MSNRSKILIIEDSSAFLNILIRLLEDDYELKGIVEATNAIKICEEFKPNIILLDLMLSGDLDGFSFLRSIKSNQNLKQIPVFIMSALTSQDMISEGLKLGASDYLVKPFAVHHLAQKVENILKLIANNRQDAVLTKHFGLDLENSSAHIVITNLEKMMEEVITTELSVVEIANRLNVSQSTLTRLVKDKYDLTTNNYIMKRRLEKANILLMSDKGLTIKQICSALNFKSVSYFTKCFKRYYGVLPSKEKEN
jgi:DNA-binding response OmpR family regulator